MKTTFFALSLAALLSTFAAAAQQAPLEEKGFRPEKMYSFGSLDNVNTFNGNLVVSIPIGRRYSLDGGLTYGLSLTYNSKVWDLTDLEGTQRAEPGQRSNAGMGWLLTMGRLVEPNDPTNPTNNWIYESPDGADHSFADSFLYMPATPCDESTCDDDQGLAWYTRDGSFLRMRVLPSGFRVVESGDGTTNEFEYDSASDHWRLRRIHGPYKDGSGNPLNYVNVTYPSPGTIAYCPSATSVWSLSDSEGRAHFVCLKDQTIAGDPVPMIDRVVLLGPGQYGTYRFEYDTDQEIIESCQDTVPNVPETNLTKYKVPFLRRVKLPDGSNDACSNNDCSRFEFESSLTGCVTGSLKSITLPTLGKIAYTYGSKNLQDPSPCPRAHIPPTVGVVTRTLSHADGAAAGTWYYDVQNVFKGLGPGDAYKSYSPCTVRQNQDAHPLIQDEAIAWVVDPAGNKVVQHYNVWPGNPGHPQYAVISPDGLRKFDYGLPIGALNTSTNLHLSREVMTGCATNGNCTNTVRRTYQRYHFDPATFSPTGETGEFHKTIEAERTEYLDDEVSSGVPRYAQVDYSGYDGFGHYRTSTTSGTFEGNNVRISTTNFNPGSNDRAKGSNGLLAIKVNEPWILGTYDSATVSEGAATETTKACFDKTTGWLRAVRTGDQNNQRDLITLFTPETSGGASNGNIARETFYGGDGSPLNSSAATQALCAIADGGNPGSIGYRILHTYTYGQRATSKYENMPFFSLNQQIELSGVITKTWDTDGDLATTYSYDRAGRLTKIEPPGLAATTYAYTNASSSSGVFAPARVNATISSSTGGAIETEYQYDAFGRFWRQKDLLRQVGQTKYWSLRETNYDALDRKISISEPEEVSGTDPSTTAHKTEFLNYDAFGRARTVKAPDNSDTTLEFKGDSTTKRTVRIATGSTTDTDAITTETYDRHGRLITVTEPAPEGALTTSYGYDVRNRLSLVLMGGQNRTFDYDRRGFLRWESHPESGMTTYTYDARGHVLSKSQSAADTLYDLTYQYDAAERPLVIRGRNPFFDPAAPNDPDEPQFRVMKKFTYGTSNVASPADRRLGKLWTAVRYNYDPNGSDDTYKVTETYLYGDTAGRKTKRTTVITTGTGVDETWWDTYRTVDTELEYNDLNLVKTVKYPSCVGCGTWNGSVPVREQTYGYTSGKLTTAPGFVDGLTYWPNGMWHTMQRNNGMLDTQEIETSTAMPRPKSISSKPSFECAPVTITSEPVGGTVTSTNPVTLSVAVSGTGDFSYEWWNAETDQIVGWDATFTATTSNTPVTTAYTVTVKNGCNSVAKATAIATVNECIAPTAGAGFEINGDGTYTLIAGGSGTEPRTYAWRRTSDQSLIGTGRKVTVGPLTSSTTYTVTIGNSCTALPSTANVTVTIKSPMMAVLSATRIDASRIHVAWTGAAIGTSYDLQRRSGPAWSTIVSLSPATSSTGGLDDTVPTAGTYAYRLVDPNGSVSNADVASTTPPTTAVSGAKITASTFAALLSTVNSVRAAVGWPPVTWANILSSNDPLPAPGAVILSVHLTSTRARMNEALQALGVPTGAYTKGTVKGIRIEAADLNEVVVRAY